MLSFKEFFDLRNVLESGNPYMTEDIFYSREEDMFVHRVMNERSKYYL